MTKKNKNRYQQQSRFQPTAPSIDDPARQSLTAISQPPSNPYYPDLELNSGSIPPPPYTDLSTRVSGPGNSVQMNRVDSTSSSTYPMLPPQQGAGPTIIVHQSPVEERHHWKIKKFNYELGLVAVIVMILSLYSRALYDRRNCVDYLVHRPNKDISISVYDVRDMHLHVACISLVVFLLSVAKCSAGKSKSYSCYMFLVGLTSLIGTFYTGYLAYLAFYSPCTMKLGDLFNNAAKTIAGGFINSLPSPDRGFFGESNVFESDKDDPYGVYIFMADLFNFITYASILLSSFAYC